MRVRLALILVPLLLPGCRDRGQDRADVDWIGNSLKQRERLRPADQQWADLIAQKDLLVLGTVPGRPAEDPAQEEQPEEILVPAEPQELEEVTIGGPASVPLLLASARGLLREGRVDDALANLRRAQAREQDNLEVLLLLGRALDRLGRSGDAAEIFKQALRLDPKNVDARYGRALALIRMGRAKSAQEILVALGTERPDDANVQRLLAIYKEHAGDDTGALDALRKSATIQSDSVDAQKNLGNAHARKGEYKDAVVALQKAVAANAEDPQLHLQLGTALGFTGDFKAAEASLMKATEMAPTNGAAWRNLAAVREQQKDAKGAIQAWESLLKNDKSPYDRREVERRVAQLKTLGFGEEEETPAAPDTPEAGDPPSGR